MAAETPATLALLQRLTGVLGRLARKYAEAAKQEAQQDAARLGTGLATLIVGAVFMVHAVAFAHAAAVAGLVALGLQPVHVLAGVLGFDVLVAVIAFAVGRSLLMRPVLPQTRAQLHELQEAYEVIVPPST